MKPRLMGTPAECTAAVEQIARVLDVIEVSGIYPNRQPSPLVRCYSKPGHDRKEKSDETS